MTKIQKSLDEEKTVTQLIVGTENKELIILEASGVEIKQQLVIEDVPTQILAKGQFTVDYRLLVVCRGGSVLEVKNGADVQQMYKIDSKPLGIVHLEKTVVLAGMD